MSLFLIVTDDLPSAADGFAISYVLIAKPLDVSAAPTVAGTTELISEAAMPSDVIAEINFFICNTSFQ